LVNTIFKDIASHRIKAELSSRDIQSLAHNLRMLHLLAYKTTGFRVFINYKSVRYPLEIHLATKRSEDALASRSKKNKFIKANASGDLSQLLLDDDEFSEDLERYSQGTRRFLRWLRNLTAWEDALCIVSEEPVFRIPELHINVNIVHPGVVEPTMTPIHAIVDAVALPEHEKDLVRHYVRAMVDKADVWGAGETFSGCQHCESTMFALICGKRDRSILKLHPRIFGREDDVETLDRVLQVSFFC
jgi:hypothetical protein